MRAWFGLFVLVSLVGLAAGLYTADYLAVPQVRLPAHLAASFLLLAAAFLADAMCWKAMLETSGFRASGGSCVAGMGLSVFGKYIPGKIWTIAGRAAYIAHGTNYPLAQLTVVSLKTQLVTLWAGLVFGTAGLWLLGGLQLWGWTLTVSWLLLTVLIFSPVAQRTAAAAARYICGKTLKLPSFQIKATLAVLPQFALAWGLWAIAFFLLAKGLLGSDVPWSTAFGFPLAVVLGIMAIVVPGGLGVREGVLVGYLTLAGVPLADATTLAVASRLWSVLGEITSFAFGLAADRLETLAQKRHS